MAGTDDIDRGRRSRWSPLEVATSALLAIAACAEPSAMPSATPKAPSEAIATPRAAAQSQLRLPSAVNVDPPDSDPAPLVSVVGTAVRVDGVGVDDTRMIVETGKPQKLEGLFRTLRAKHLRDKQEQPSRPARGDVVFHFDAGEKLAVVKSVYQIAAFAAFPNAQFAVKAPDGGEGRLNVRAFVPAPPGANVPPPEKTLHVEVRADEAVLVWREGQAGPEVGAAARTPLSKLTAAVADAWKTGGRHRDRADLRLDSATVHIDDAAEYRSAIAVIDAIYGAKRDAVIDGKSAAVPAFWVTLAVK
jgi:hypothetical protein